MAGEKFVNVSLKAFAGTTVYASNLEGLKVGDFVIVPSWSGPLTGRVVSFSKQGGFGLKKPQQLLRRATPEEINEVADVFGIPKNPDIVSEDEDESFFTNSGYGTKELNKLVKKYQEKQTKKEATTIETETKTVEQPELKRERLVQGPIKDDEGLPIYWRYVAIGILALYFLKDFIF